MELNLPVAFLTGSPPDWIIIAIVALVVFGPKKLPELGRQLGQAMRDINKIRDEFTGTVHSVHNELESVYKPAVAPYSAPHTISSPTVEAATTRHVYDQDPEDLMAPVVPEIAHPDADGKLLVPPPVAVSATEALEKGH